MEEAVSAEMGEGLCHLLETMMSMLLNVKQIDTGGVVNVLHPESSWSMARTDDGSRKPGDTNKKDQESGKVSARPESQADDGWRPHWEDKHYRAMVRR